MALVAVQRSPSNSNSSSTISASDNDEDEPDLIMKRVCECFFAIKGAALILPHSTDPRPIKKHPVVGELQQHLQSIFFLLRTQDTITLAVRLESMYTSHIRYMVLVSTLGVNDTEETIILGVDIRNAQCTVGLVLPIWRDTDISMDGDGGFGVHTSQRAYIFKPVSIQAMWSAIQCLNKTCQIARNRNYIPAGLNLTWAGYYSSSLKLSTPKCVYEWNLLPDTYSHIQEHMTYHEGFVEGGHYCPSERELTERYIWVKLREIMMHVDLDNITGKQLRLQLEEEMGRDLTEYKRAIDKQAMTILGQMDSASKILDFLYLGSEWNASNYDEMNKLGIRYVLNVSLEIDNFFPLHFTYHNVRVHDDLQADLLRHWDETYRYISKAKETGTKALVHCKMGMSRSAATVIAFVMKEMGWSLEKSFSYVKERRSIAQPNPNFMEQLNEYQGILDASKQRHNALWRSKSESDLSTCGSMENICHPPPEVFSSSEDLSASLRRRSWSPEDSVAEALIGFPEHTETSYVGELYLRNPSPTGQWGRLADQEKEASSSDEDACSEINIPVPTLPQSPRAMDTTTASGVSPKASSSLLSENPNMGSGMDGAVGPTADTVESNQGQAVEQSRAAGKELGGEEDAVEIEDPLNTNNNSATCLERLRDSGGIEVGDEEGEGGTVPVDVKERISTIESQISMLDSSSGGSPEKAKPESPPLLDELPADTVRRTRRKLERQMKGDRADTIESEEDLGFLADTEMDLEAEMEVVCEGGEEDISSIHPRAGEGMGETSLSEVACPEERPDPSQLDPSLVHHEPNFGGGSVQSYLGSAPPQYSSPSLAKLEPGTVLKNREKFQAWQIKGWKSPNYDDDSMAKFESVRIDPKAQRSREEGEGPKDVPTNSGCSGDEQDASKNIAVSGGLENVDCTVSPGQSDALEQTCERHIPADVDNEDISILGGESVESESDTENFIVIPTGEEIPLQPGTVRKQREGFEQLSSSDRPKEASDTGESRTPPEDVCIPMDETGASGATSGAQHVGHEEGETLVESEEPCLITKESGDCLIRNESGRTSEGEASGVEENESKHLGVDAASSGDVVTLPELTVGGVVAETGGEDECSVSPEEGEFMGSTEEGGWRMGEVRKHTQELEKLASAVSVSVPKNIATSPKALGEGSEVSLSSEKLQEIRDLGRMILAKDDTDESETDEKDPGNSEGARPSSYHSSTWMSEDNADGQDFVRVAERVRHIELKRCATIASMSSEKVSRKYRKHWMRFGSKEGSPEKKSLASDPRGGSTPTPVSQDAGAAEESVVSAELGASSTTPASRVHVANYVPGPEGMKTPETERTGGGSPSPSGSKVIPGHVAGEGESSPLGGTNPPSSVPLEVVADSPPSSDAKGNVILGRGSPPTSGSKVNAVQGEDALVGEVKSRSNTDPARARTDSLRTQDYRAQECPKLSEKGTGQRTGGGDVPKQTPPPAIIGKDQAAEGVSPLSAQTSPPPRLRPDPGEKKPYGPTHPLARLRQSSGKHPFYSTM